MAISHASRRAATSAGSRRGGYLTGCGELDRLTAMMVELSGSATTDDHETEIT